MEANSEPVVDDKEFATLRAKCALAGVSLTRASDGGFLASRWNFSRKFSELEDIEPWLERMRGSKP